MNKKINELDLKKSVAPSNMTDIKEEIKSLKIAREIFIDAIERSNIRLAKKGLSPGVDDETI